MTRLLLALIASALLGGCIVLPLDYGHRGGHGHRHFDGYQQYDDGGRGEWRDRGRHRYRR